MGGKTIAALAAGALALGGVGAAAVATEDTSTSPTPTIQTQAAPPHAATESAGQYTATVHWAGVTEPGQTGYHVYQDGTQVADTTTPSYTFTSLDCGTTYTFGVAGHDASGHTTPTSSTTHTTPACPTGGGGGTTLQVGAPTPTGVTCTSHLNTGADVEASLSAASPGATVCLNAGSWGVQSIAGVSPASNVTLAATPGQTVNVTGFRFSNVSNLTVEGFYIQNSPNDGIDLLNAASNITLSYNTIEGLSDQYAILGAAGGSNTQSNITISYNQLDNAATFVEAQGNSCGCSTPDVNWTIAHNVMGPGQDYGGQGHFIEGQWSGASINNNAFLGPTVFNPAAHNNVFHCYTFNAPGCQNVTFANNIIWHAQSRADTVLITDNTLANITIQNNLDVDDPLCQDPVIPPDGLDCHASPWFVDKADGLTMLNNTSAQVVWSIVMSHCDDGCIATPGNYNIQNNLATGVPAAGQSNFGNYGCVAAPCVAQNNASQDNSATSTFGASNVNNWTPSWQNTTWTWATNGATPPYVPPPAGYYQPNPSGGVTSNMGYQGTPCTTTIRTNCIGP